MTDKPDTYLGYNDDDLDTVKRCCLYIATVLGDLLDDIVIVGGLVPPLLIAPKVAPAGDGSHSLLTTQAATKDLDLALGLSIFDDAKYTEIHDRMRSAGFSNDAPSLFRWRIEEPRFVTVDFLIEQDVDDNLAGKSKFLANDLAPIRTPGLNLAFADRKNIRMKGYTVLDEWVEKDIGVCGIGAFIVLKSLAVSGRRENKDAYDLIYALNATMFDESLRSEVLAFLHDNRNDECVEKAFETIKGYFGQHDSIGPMNVARFLTGHPDDNIQADAVGLIKDLLSEMRWLA